MNDSSKSEFFKFNGLGIEDLFHRKGQRGMPFHQFSIEERMALESYLRNVANFKTVDMGDSWHTKLTTPPPLAADDNGLVAKAEWARHFAVSITTCGRRLVHKIIADLHTLPIETCFLPIWRAGLCMIPIDVEGAYCLHIGASRNPTSLKTDLYFRGALPATPRKCYVICDAMIGTGNTILKTIEYLMLASSGTINEATISVSCIFITPEAAVRLASRYPKVKVFTACMDTHLDSKGWVIHNSPDTFLGDFGDLITESGVASSIIADLLVAGLLDPTEHASIRNKLCMQGRCI